VLHHGVRVILLGGLALLTTLLFPPAPAVQVAPYEVGMVADEEIQARVDFDVDLSPAELEEARAEARGSVPPTFNVRPEAADTMAARLGRFFDRLDAAAETGEPRARIGEVLRSASVEPTPSQVELLTDPEIRAILRRAALRAAREILPTGVADAADLRDVTTDRITVRERSGGAEVERSVPVEQVLSNRELYSRAISLLPLTVPPDVQDLLRLFLIQHLEYTYELNVTATELDRAGAAGAVPTVRREVAQGEAIVRANEQITEETLEALAAYQEALEARGMTEERGAGLGSWLGAGVVNLLLLSVFGLLVLLFRRELYTNLRWILLLALLVAVYLAAAALVVGRGWPVETLPVAFVALTVAVLWDGRMALALVMTLAILTGIQRGLDPVYAILLLTMGGSAAALSVRAVRRRAQTWIFIALIAGAYAAAILGHGLLVGVAPAELLRALGWAATNAVFSAIVAMGFLPVFEWITGVTTDQTLLEWADPNRSLLKRLSMEAPGTYAHTINVANLAEAAANAIGANGLLCRVGLYYHDVGKMLKPHYFVENQPAGRNPHDRLKPDTSAAIVKEHVTEGVRLAREANVPDVVVDFVSEHHGTQRIGFFYQKALEEYGEENVDPEDFSYPGPRPRSRETAISMLADSVESATRALQEPTPERIRGLIDSIVDAKIADHQLDDAPLTLREVAAIKEQFAKVLSGVYHHRLDYPQTRHLTEKPAAGEVAGSGPEAGSGPDAGNGSDAEKDRRGRDTGGGGSARNGPDAGGGPGEPVVPGSAADTPGTPARTSGETSSTRGGAAPDNAGGA
jgi:hypothetical protein